MKNLPFSLAVKINLILFVAAAIFLFSIAQYEYKQKSKQYDLRLQENLERSADRLSHSLTTPLWNFSQSELETIASIEMSSPHMAYLELFDNSSDKVILNYAKDRRGNVLDLLQTETMLLSGSIKYKMLFIEKDGEKIGFLTIGVNNDYLLEDLDRWFREFVGFGFLAFLVFTFLSASLLHHFVTKPINNLQDAFNNFELEPKQNVKKLINRRDELGRLTHSFLTIRENLLLLLKEVDSKIRNLNVASKENERLQQQLIQSQKMDAIGRLAGGVAHDFNNILTAIFGFSSLALSKLNPESTEYNYIQEIVKSADRCKELTTQLLGFARKQAVSPTVMDLNDKISKALPMLKSLVKESVTIELDLDKDIHAIKMDAIQIDQILLNLCTNAKDAIETTDGIIRIKTRNQFNDAIPLMHFPEFKAENFIHLSVSDNGKGMSQDVISQVFEPFFTANEKRKGTGLGLSTVYGIVKQNQGFILVESEETVGTTFNIYLPVYQGEDGSKTNEDRLLSTRGNGEKILIVEDEAAIVLIAKTILSDLGYDVTTTTSPKKAIDIVNNRQRDFDLLISDVIMPEMNGNALSEKVLEMMPDIKIVFISGYVPEELNQKITLNKKADFLQKPFTPDSLADVVYNALHK